MSTFNFTTTSSTFSLNIGGATTYGPWDRVDEIDSIFNIELEDNQAVLTLKNPYFSDIIKATDTVNVNASPLSGTLRAKVASLKDNVLFLPAASGGGVTSYNNLTDKPSVVYPEFWGWSTAATGAVNSAALQSAIDALGTDGGTVAITKAGTYVVGASHFIGSNTTIDFAPGIILQKTNTSNTNMVYIFASKALRDGGRNTNIKLLGNGLQITIPVQANGDGGTQTRTLNGQFSFYNVDNFTFSGINVSIAGSGWTQYFAHISGCTNGVMENMVIDFPKDGVDIMNSTDIKVRNIIFSTADDCIFVGNGWPISDEAAGDCDRITIENIRNLGRTGSIAHTVLGLTDAWDDWASSAVYGPRDYALNGGNLYRMMNGSGFITAANAPVHTSGTVTGADLIQWKFIKATTSYSSNVSNLTLRNVSSIGSGNFAQFYQEPTAQQRTHKSLFDNIILEKCYWKPPVTTTTSFKAFCALQGYASKITLTDCRVDVNNYTATTSTFGADFFQANLNTWNGVNGTTSIDELEINSCYVDMSTNGNFIYNNNNANFTGKVLRVNNTTVLGTYANSHIGYIAVNSVTQWNTIKINNSSLSNCPRMIEWNSGLASGTWNIDLSNVTFVTPRYVLVAGPVGTTTNFNSNGGTFETPNQSVFYNSGAGSTGGATNISTFGSKGGVTTFSNLYGSVVTNYNFINCDLPINFKTFGSIVTAAGSTGAKTISKMSGRVNFAAAATSLVVTNSLITASSMIFLSVKGSDATATFARVSAQSNGSFTITLNAAATAETAVDFFVLPF